VATAELKSLVLAGGASTRMGADKAFLSYHGEPQVNFLARTLSRICKDVRVSINRSQLAGGRLDGLKLLVDRDEHIGPMEGLLNAFACAPQAAWLAVAVDLPCVTERTLLRLASLRDAMAYATAFRNPETGLPEPVLAIYEPAILPTLESARTSRKYSLMFLRDVPVHLIEAEDRRELWNVNDANDYREFQETIKGTTHEI
jgi:molybdopterin-guanine dinucleotide biosynthesis protein A